MNVQFVETECYVESFLNYTLLYYIMSLPCGYIFEYCPLIRKTECNKLNNLNFCHMQIFGVFCSNFHYTKGKFIKETVYI